MFWRKKPAAEAPSPATVADAQKLKNGIGDGDTNYTKTAAQDSRLGSTNIDSKGQEAKGSNQRPQIDVEDFDLLAIAAEAETAEEEGPSGFSDTGVDDEDGGVFVLPSMTSALSQITQKATATPSSVSDKKDDNNKFDSKHRHPKEDTTEVIGGDSSEQEMVVVDKQTLSPPPSPAPSFQELFDAKPSSEVQDPFAIPSESHPNQELFDILERNFQNQHSGTSAYLSTTSGLTTSEESKRQQQVLKACFLALVYTTTSPPLLSGEDSVDGEAGSISGTGTSDSYLMPTTGRPHSITAGCKANSDESSADEKMKDVKDFTPPNIGFLHQALAKSSTNEHSSSSRTVFQRRTYVPLTIVYELWNEIINASDSSNEQRRSDYRDVQTNSSSLDSVRDALISLGVITLVEEASSLNSNSRGKRSSGPSSGNYIMNLTSSSSGKHDSRSSGSHLDDEHDSGTKAQHQLIRLSEDIHYEFGMWWCRKRHAVFVQHYQAQWHSAIFRAASSCMLEDKDDTGEAKHGEGNTVFYNVWDNRSILDKTMFYIDAGYALLMLPRHFTLGLSYKGAPLRIPDSVAYDNHDDKDKYDINSSFTSLSCCTLLSKVSFMQRRLDIMGIRLACQIHIQDIQRLCKELNNDKIKSTSHSGNLDQQSVLRKSLITLKKLVMLIVNEEASSSNVNENIGANNALAKIEAGIAIHAIGVALGEMGTESTQNLDEIACYELALKLKQECFGPESLEVAETLHCMAFYFDSSGNVDKAMNLYTQALRLKIQILGRDHPYVSKTVHNMGALYCYKGDLDKAIHMFQEALRVRTVALGANHDSVADTLQWMANVRREQSMADEAIGYFNESLRIKSMVLGKDHLDTGNVCHNLGIVYDDIGNFEFSLKCYREALRVRQLQLGETHDLVAESYQCIGNVLCLLEQHEEALEVFSQAITIRENLLVQSLHKQEQPFLSSLVSDEAEGKDDMSIESSAKDLSRPKVADDKVLDSTTKEAVSSGKPALTVAEGESDSHQNQLDKLLDCHEEALNLARLVHGDQSSTVSSLRYRMGQLYERKAGTSRIMPSDNDDGNFINQAITCYQEVVLVERELKSQQEMEDDTNGAKIGFAPWRMIHALYRLGVLFATRNASEHVVTFLKECLRCRESEETDPMGKGQHVADVPSFSEYHADLLHLMGVSYLNIDALEDAMDFLQQSKQVRSQESSYNPKEASSTKYAQTIRYMGLVNEATGNLDEALNLLLQAQSLLDEDNNPANGSDFSKAHARGKDTNEKERLKANLLVELGHIYEGRDASSDDTRQALDCYNRAATTLKSNFGPNDEELEQIYYSMGNVHAKLQNQLQALEEFQNALRIAQLYLESSDLSIAHIWYNTGLVRAQMGDNVEGLDAFQKALDIYRHNSLAPAELEAEEGEEPSTNCLMTMEVANTLHNMAALFDKEGQYAQAIRHYKESLNIKRQHLLIIEEAEDDTDASAGIAQTLNNLGITQAKLHQYQDAIEALSESLRIKRRVFGGGGSSGGDQPHISVAATLHNLAHCFASSNSSQLDKAIVFFQEALRQRQTLLGSDCPQVATTLHSMGEAYTDAHKYEDAIQCLRVAIQIRRSKLGEEHPLLAESVQQLGLVYARQDSYKEATELWQEALRINRLADNVAQDCTPLVELLLRLADLMETQQQRKNDGVIFDSNEEAVQGEAQSADTEEAATARSIRSYYEEAVQTCRHHKESTVGTSRPNDQSGYRRETKSGEGSPLDKLSYHDKQQTLLLPRVLHLFGSFLLRIGEPEQALSNFQESLELRTKKTISVTKRLEPSDSKERLTSYSKRSSSKKEKKKSQSPSSDNMNKVKEGKEAEVKRRGSFPLKSGEGNMPSDQPLSSFPDGSPSRNTNNNSTIQEVPGSDYGVLLEDIGRCYIELSNWSQATYSLEQSLQIHKQRGVEEHKIEIATTLMQLGRLQDKQGLTKQALKAAQGAYQIFKSEPSMIKTAKLADVCVLVASLLGQIGDFIQAKLMLKEALEIQKSLFGLQSKITGATLMELGHILVKAKELREALTMYQQCLQIALLSKTNSGSKITCNGSIPDSGGKPEEGHMMRVCDIRTYIGDLQFQLGFHTQALEEYHKALDIAEAQLGTGSLAVAKILVKIGDVHDTQETFSESFKCYSKALPALQMYMPSGETKLVTVLRRVAAQHVRLKEYEEGLEYYKQVLRAQAHHLGSNQLSRQADAIGKRDQALTMCQVGYILGTMDHGKKAQDAVQIYKEALRLLGEFDQACTAGLFGAYGTNIDKGVTDKAKAHLHMAQLSQRLTQEPLHPPSAPTSDSWKEAQHQLLQEALENYMKYLKFVRETQPQGENSLEFGNVLMEIGNIYSVKEDNENALKCWSKVLAIRVVHLDKYSTEIAAVLLAMGKVYDEQRRDKEALQALEKASAIYKKRLSIVAPNKSDGTIKIDLSLSAGKDSSDTVQDDNSTLCLAKALFLTGGIYLRQKQLGRALPFISHTYELLYTKRCDANGKAEHSVDGGPLSSQPPPSLGALADKESIALIDMCRLRLGMISIEHKKSQQAIEYLNDALDSKQTRRRAFQRETEAQVAAGATPQDQSSMAGDNNELMQEMKEDMEDAKIHFQLGRAFEMEGQFDEAKTHFVTCLKTQLLNTQQSTPEIGHSMAAIGRLLFKLQCYNESLQQLEEAQKIFRKQIGKQSLEALGVAYQMCLVYEATGEHQKAMGCIKYTSQALQKSLKKVKGEDAPAAMRLSAETSLKMGELLVHQGQQQNSISKEYEQAVGCYKDATNILKQLSGPDSLEVMNVFEKIAAVLQMNEVGQYEAALQCWKEVRRIRDVQRMSSGADFAKLLSTMGGLHMKVKQTSQAMECYKLALTTYHTLEGSPDSNEAAAKANNLEMAAVLWKLAKLYILQRQDGLALDALRKTLRLHRLAGGDDSIDVGLVLRDKGSLHEAREEPDEALDCYVECLRIHEVYRDGVALSGTLENQPNHDAEMLQVMKRAGHLALRVNPDEGLDDDSVAFSPINVDNNNDAEDPKRREKQRSRAMGFFRQAEQLASSSNHIDSSSSQAMADIWIAMGELFAEAGNLREAVDKYTKALTLQRSIVRNTNGRNSTNGMSAEMAATSYTVGSLYIKLKDYSDALKFLDEALKIRKALMTPTSTQTEFMDLADTLYKIGVVLKHVGQYDKSMRCLEQSLSVQEAKGGGQPSVLVAKTLNNMGVVASKLGNYASAARIWHRAIDEYKRSMPNIKEGDHIVQAIRGNIAMAERLCIP